MPSTPHLASSDEIRVHFIEQLGSVLRRPAAYGDLDTAVWFLMDHLLVSERDPGAWQEEQSRLAECGAWYADGVQGVFARLLPKDPAPHTHTASVYAEFAHRRGWLTLDRVLSAAEYHAMRDALPGWCAEDRQWPDVTAAFGEPSAVIGGPNPRTSKALVYATAAPEVPVLVLHLWNDYSSGRPQPAVLASRVGGTLHPEAFAFTPLGRSLRGSDEGGRDQAR
ncbi:MULTISPECIES: hypothetical protein [Streptomyces]|uniref:hypothetical protein n=1 Tax=Streptomyces TaxID=1883 RepID=UPI00167AA574|nr:MULTISPECIES: hypothetical protein [Streptomyces]MBD3579236.1 hypothetical protein [Streptomyces sp. KD18]